MGQPADVSSDMSAGFFCRNILSYVNDMYKITVVVVPMLGIGYGIDM
jgi:hypothetical protein